MRFALPAVAFIALSVSGSAQSSTQPGTPANPDLPKDPKVLNTYTDGIEFLRQHDRAAAMSAFKKADKQDGGHCAACRQRILDLGEKTGDYKSADAAAQEAIEDAQAPAAKADAHMDRGMLLLREGVANKKQDPLVEADKEFKTVVGMNPKYSSAYFADGLALGHMRQDDAAKAEFEQFIQIETKAGVERARAERYIERPDLVRARMAPAFAVATMDGKRISLDDLTGKVVLMDFWATWCGPCREALPHMQKIAQKFKDEPLVIVSVSLDNDANDQKWRTFVAQNQMTWLQVRDGGWTGPLATGFGVNAIPHTFTIDADGVMQDEHIGDESIERKLKKLCEQARKLQEAPKAAVAAGQ